MFWIDLALGIVAPDILEAGPDNPLRNHDQHSGGQAESDKKIERALQEQGPFMEEDRTE